MGTDLFPQIEAVFARGRTGGYGGKMFDLVPTALRFETGVQLAELVMAENAKRTAETGFALGISTLFFLHAHLQMNAGPGSHAAVDPLQHRGFDGAGLKLLEELNVRNQVEFVEEDSKLVLPQWLREGRQLDLALVDGDHRFEGAFLDLYYLHRLVKPGGLIVVDDLWMPSVRAAVAYFVTNMGSRPLEFGQPPRKKRSLLGFRRQRTRAGSRMMALRTPDPPPKLGWNQFVPFWEQTRTAQP